MRHNGDSPQVRSLATAPSLAPVAAALHEEYRSAARSRKARSRVPLEPLREAVVLALRALRAVEARSVLIMNERRERIDPTDADTFP